MKQKTTILIILLFLIIILYSNNLYAQQTNDKSWTKSYIDNSPFIFSISASLIFSFTGMIEINLGKFYFGQIPLNYCFGFITPLFIQVNSLSLALSPFLSIHLGLSSLPIEFIEAIGFGLNFGISNDIKPNMGFTALFQINYYLASNNGIFMQISTISGLLNYGFGIFFNSKGGK